MATTSDSPIQMPGRNYTADEKVHRAGNRTVELFGQIAFLAFIPVGGIVGYADVTAPPGFLECNGAAVNRRAYKELFSVCGTRFGAGDGSTTFNVPTRAQASAIFGGTAAASTLGIMIIRAGVF